MKRALILSGGGVKGAWQVGVLRALARQGAWFDVVAGVSTGALTAAVLCQTTQQAGLAPGVVKMLGFYTGLTGSGDIYDAGGLFWQALRFLRTGALYKPSGLQQLIQANIDPAQIAKSPILLRFGSVNLTTGRYETFSNVEYTPELLLASASVPGLFPPVEAHGNLWADGGIANITPLNDGFEGLKLLAGPTESLEATLLIASPLQGLALQQEHGLLGIWALRRAIEIALHDAFLADIQYAIEINQRIVTAELLQPPKYRNIPLTIYAPTTEYAESLDFDPKKIAVMLADGEAAQPIPEKDVLRGLQQQ